MINIKQFVLIICTNLLVFVLYSNNINLNNSFANDTIISPFSSNQIYGLTTTGSITLNSDTSLVRIIVTTQSGNEYMLYEAYPLITSELVFDITNVCDETCYLDGEIAENLRIEIINAEVWINFLTTSESYVQNAGALQLMEKYICDANKTDLINQNISKLNFHWTAGNNSMVEKFYFEKKQRWGENYNLFGYEYYKGGVFEVINGNYANVASTIYIDSWDWRNRHGANNPLSEYYDDDEYNSGWLTPSKDQGFCGSCGVFSAIGSIESTINLYYNQQLDFDLSEQQQIACIGEISCAGGWPHYVFNFIESDYVVDEMCYEYLNDDGVCTHVCEDPETKISLNDVTHHLYDTNLEIDDVQLLLKTHGPLSWVFLLGTNNLHSVTLVGWIYDSNSDRVNLIYKDNQSPDWGDGGFGIIPAPTLFRYIGFGSQPIFITPNTPSVMLRDEDGDGIDNWGIGDKPPGASNYIDCDDNNPLLGKYNADLSCQCLATYNSDPIIIDEPETWDTDFGLEQPVYINAGGELKITSTIFIQEDVKIKVNPGGSLIIDGGILTKACYNMWKGIEVVGDNSIPQFPYSNQGYLSIQNNGQIKYAEMAILVGETSPITGELMYNKAGGIVKTDDATFLNNINDVKFLPYFDSQYITNESHFHTTSFETNDTELLMFTPEVHLELNEVYGITIEGCHFTYIGKEGISEVPEDEKGIGILAYDAGIHVGPGCLTSGISPCQEFSPSIFTGLRYGIKAFNTGANKLFSVASSEFYHNTAGIYLSGYNQAEIYDNLFSISIDNMAINLLLDPFYGGVYLDGSSGYKIEYNEFQGNFFTLAGIISSTTIGIYVKDSGEDDNEIYNNVFHNLIFGIVAEGVNKGEETGLTIKCNDAFDNQSDFFVVFDPVNTKPRSLTGIKEMQGADANDTKKMAGNTFSKWFENETATDIRYWNYNNQGDNFIYFHHQSNAIFQVLPMIDHYTDNSISLNNSFDIIYSKNEACPPNTSSGEVPLIANADANIVSYETQLLNITDGGNTDEVNTEISNSVVDEGLILKNQLISYSPYLSDTVLKSAIKKEDVLLNPMLRDVLIQNPQAAKSEEILDVIDNRINTMPGYMMNEILDGKNAIGAKEILESKLAYWKNERSRSINSMIRGFLADSLINHPFDSIILVYENEVSLSSRYRLAFTHINNNDLSSALGVINSIQSEFDLDNYHSSIHQNYLDYFDVLEQMKDSGLLVTQLETNKISTLTGIMENDFPQISAYARGMLVKGDYIDYCERIILPATIKSKRIYSNDRPTSLIVSGQLKITPNPARNYILIDYDIINEQGQGLVILRDMQGTLITSELLQDSKNQITIDSSKFPPGIYIVSLYAGGNHINSQKLSIVR